MSSRFIIFKEVRSWAGLAQPGKLPTFPDATFAFPTKWRLNDSRNSILMTGHYPDLGSASDWLKPIFSGRVAKCWLFSQARTGPAVRAPAFLQCTLISSPGINASSFSLNTTDFLFLQKQHSTVKYHKIPCSSPLVLSPSGWKPPFISPPKTPYEVM